jgi:hypothetical protein
MDLSDVLQKVVNRKSCLERQKLLMVGSSGSGQLSHFTIELF